MTRADKLTEPATFLAVAVSFFFGFLRLTSLLNIRFYYYYSPETVNITVFSSSIDLWIWAASLLLILVKLVVLNTSRGRSAPRWTFLPCILLLVSLAAFLINNSIASLFAAPLGFLIAALSIYYVKDNLRACREQAVSLTLVCFAGILILFEAASATSWISNTIDYEVSFGPSSRWIFPRIDLQLFNVLYPLTSWLFLIFLYSWIWIPAAKHVLPRFSALKRLVPRIEVKGPSPIQDIGSNLKLSRRHLTLALLLSLAASAFVAYYPSFHLPASTLAGADSIDYRDWLNEMTRKGPITALEKDRPLFNLLLYSINYLVGSPETTVRIMPAILAVCLGLAVFLFVKTGTGDERLALLSSLFSAFSYQTTIGVFSYITANWFGIVEAFLLLIFLLKFFENHSWKDALTSTLFGVALLLTHPYTWNFVIAIPAAYLVWILVKRRSQEKASLIPLAFLLTTNLLVYAVYSVTPFGKGVGQAEGGTIQTALMSIGVSSFLNLQTNLASMIQNWVGGVTGNPLLIILATAGTLSTRNLTKRYNSITLLWTMIPSVVLLATPPEYFWRIIYVTPVQILAPAGLNWIIENLRNRFKTSQAHFHILKMSIVTVVLLFLLNYALRSVDEAVLHIL